METFRSLTPFEAFEEITDELLSFSSLGIRPGLERVSRLLSRLGSPQDRFKAIHVLGTNGKGSTAAMLESICRASGMRTALYTSPHLVSLQERLRVDRSELPEAAWRAAFTHVKEAVASDPELASSRPTFFENLTAMAFLMIAQAEPDIAIIEAGMGGRYDATSVCDALATVITPIGMDHTEYLGDTLKAIASEKFAAIRGGVPAFYAGDDDALCGLFTRQCDAVGSPWFLLDVLAHPVDIRCTLDGTSFSYVAGHKGMTDLFTPLVGIHQADNAARVVSVLAALARTEGHFHGVSEQSIRRGLTETSWAGRFETIRRSGFPVIILDGAHNPHGLHALRKTLDCLKGQGQMGEVRKIVFAVMKDKSLLHILEELKSLNCPVACTQLPMERSLSAYELEHLASSQGLYVEGVYTDPLDAIMANAPGSSDVVVCCGSLFLVGYLRKALGLS